MSNQFEDKEVQNLFIPLSHEEVVQAIGEDTFKLLQFVSPVVDVEEKIIRIISSIEYSGYLLPIQGFSGVGKSTFVNSLEWRPHIPIKKVVSIDASFFSADDGSQLQQLYSHLSNILKNLFETEKTTQQDFLSLSQGKEIIPRFCFVFEYLEIVSHLNKAKLAAFFKNLNAILRKYPILLIWLLTDNQQLQLVQEYGKSFSSMIFHRRVPYIHFQGPDFEEYPQIFRDTTSVFNSGKSIYDFQISDHDLENILYRIKQSPLYNRNIRGYLKEMLNFWEDNTNQIAKLSEFLPKNSEIWIVVFYPSAESTVARFVRESNELKYAWNLDYSRIKPYATDNSRESQWSTSKRLLSALSGCFTTKLIYLSTNFLVSCVASYGLETGVPITRKELEDLGVPPKWFQKSQAKKMFSSTVLFKMLNGESCSVRKTGGGKTDTALKTATPAFEKINEIISSRTGSDVPFNKAICSVLQDSFSAKTDLKFSAEMPHPWLRSARPDVLVDVSTKKSICLEFFYTADSAPNVTAGYCLDKLNSYMSKLEHLANTGQRYIPGITS